MALLNNILILGLFSLCVVRSYKIEPTEQLLSVLNRTNNQASNDSCKKPNGSFGISCNTFVICIAGKVIYQLNCMDGTYYNDDEGHCSATAPMECQPENDPNLIAPPIHRLLCTNKTGFFAKDEYYPCVYFIYCQNWQVKWKTDCMEATYNEAVVNICAQNPQFGCRSISEVAQNEYDKQCASDYGNFAISCTEYVFCRDGHALTIHQCEAGTFFDYKSEVCINEPPTGCAAFNQSHQQIRDLQCLADSGLFSNNAFCSGYVYCHESRVLYEYDCYDGQYFDQDTEMCTSDLPIGCKPSSVPVRDSRCSELNGFSSLNGSCTKHVYCIQGEVKIELDCIHGAYFDSAIQRCTSNPPSGCIQVTRSNHLNNSLCKSDCGYFPVPHDCSQFVFCLQGEITFECNCNATEYYDRNLKICTATAASECENFNEILHSVCNRDNGFIPVNGSCTKFRLCINGKIDFVTEYECVDGTYFDAHTETCTINRPSYCVLSDHNGPCFNKSGNVAVGNSCTEYVYCKDQQLIQELVCEAGTYFDSVLQKCTSTIIPGCEPPPFSPENVTLFPPCLKSSGYFAVGISCTQFVRCDNGMSQAFGYVCPPGTYFDANLETCTFNVPALCKDIVKPVADSRCLSQIGTFPVPGSCTKYVYCLDGNVTRELECNEMTFAANSHFDAITARCTLNPPPGCGQRKGDPRCTKDTGYSQIERSRNQFVYCIRSEVSFTYTCDQRYHFDPNLEGCTLNPFSINGPLYVAALHGGDPRCNTDTGIFPTSCRTYVICMQGAVLYESECADGLFFDMKLKSCVENQPTYCQLEELPPIADDPKCLSNLGVFSINGSHTQYVYCMGSQVIYEFECGSGTYFYPQYRQCRVAQPEDFPIVVVSPCTEINGYYAVSGSCTEYVYCIRGQRRFEFTCEAGLYYDSTLEECTPDAPPRCRG